MTFLLTIGSISLKAQDDNVVTIGDVENNTTTPSYYYPVRSKAYYNISQHYYLKDEINKTNGFITELAFHVYSSNDSYDYSRNIEIYLLSSDETYFNAGETVAVSSAKKVFSGNIKFEGSNNWVSVPLTTPFEYNGNNILVCINDITGSQTDNTDGNLTFSVLETTQARSIYQSNINTATFGTTPYTPTVQNETKTPINQVPFIKFTFGDGAVAETITLSADKTEIVADNSETVTFTVKQGESIINEGYTIHQMEGTGPQGTDPEVGNPFKTSTAGTYTFYARYEELTSETIEITATPPATPDPEPEDPELGENEIELSNANELTNAYIPTRMYSTKSVSQHYYLASEIGSETYNGRSITNIKFRTTTGDYENENRTRSLTVYMTNAGTDVFPTDGTKTMVQMNKTDIVFEGDITFNADQWVDIDLDNDFAYEGGNILLCVYDYTGNSTTEECYFKTYEGADMSRTRYINGAETPDPTAQIIEDASRTAQVPFVRFTFTAAVAEPITLVPSPSANITTCDNVTFIVSQGTGTGKDVTTECKVYQENGTEPATELPDKTFVPTATGTYTFYATMGTQESERVEIIVDEADYELIASPETIVVNNAVVFSVEQCGEVVEGFTFDVDGEVLDGSTFLPAETGEYIVTATKDEETVSTTITVREQSEWYVKGWVTNNAFVSEIYGSKYTDIVEITNGIFTLWMAITGNDYDNGIILNNNCNLYGSYSNYSFEQKTDHRPATPQPLSLPETIYVDEDYGVVTITEIADEVFYNTFEADAYGISDGGNVLNDNISSVTLPSTITKIGVNAFRFTMNSTHIITCKAIVPPTVAATTFDDSKVTKYAATLLVHSSSVEAYKNHAVWGKFYEIETDPGSVIVYNGNGDWKEAANWNTGIVPSEGDEVEINGNVVITDDVTVNKITINESCSLTIKDGGILNTNEIINNGKTLVIEDGGQLYYNSTEEIEVTMKKVIKGYGDDDNVGYGWYTISSPTFTDKFALDSEISFNITPINSVNNLIPANENQHYDLYRYYEAGDFENNGWWENYKQGDNQMSHLEDLEGTFESLTSCRGYLYANSKDVTLEFTGKIELKSAMHFCTNFNINDDFRGFNLIGNPFTHDITTDNIKGLYMDLVLAEGFYTVTNAGEWEPHLLSDVIKPTQGALIKIISDNMEDLHFYTIDRNVTVSPYTRRDNTGAISIDITNEKFSDRAFVSFSEGHGLNKYPHLNKEAHEVYIPVDGVDYAVATMNEDVKEIPISFEAKTFGQYTIGVKTQDCDFNTMTLIDKLTGNETNLLTDTYTFFARTTDNPNRFVLTLSSDTDTDSDFIYINNGEMIINNIEGNGHVVVYDIMGRPMAEYNVSGSANISIESFANGVYIVRMTDDNGVKTQKIIRN